MSIEFKLPELGENITTADVVSVLVKVGDVLKKEQPVLELETEKAVFELPSSVVGTVKEIHVKVGDKVKVGQLLLTVEEGGVEKESGVRGQGSGVRGQGSGVRSQESGEEIGGGKKKTEVSAKQHGGSASGGRSQKSESKQEEKEVEKGEEPRAGKAPEKPAKEKPETPEKEPEEKKTQPSRASSGEIPASPLVRRLARELNVDLKEISGSGPDGRILPADVTVHLEKSPGVGASPALPDFTKWGAVERKPMSNVRRTTADHVSRAWSAIPHVTQFDEADITELEELRKRFAKRVETAGGHLSLTAILLKVAASALKVFPQMNASVDLELEEIVYKNYFNIGIAVATDRGLLVPVIRDVDQKNILDLSIELRQITEKARSKKLTLEEMQGASFTITNLGNIGGDHFTPIINWPEVAILGVGRAKVESVWVEGKFEPRTMLPLSLSYDHRLIDGADGAKFLRWLAEAVTEPFLMDLEG